jgi:predicted  nucleic acid-binding Zn-ribbon protein
MECGKKFRTVSSALRAQSVGCPNCGGSDIDAVEVVEKAGK